MNENAHLRTMWSSKIKRSTVLIVPTVTYQDGEGSLNNDSWAFYGSIIEALTIYKQKFLWKKLILNCLRCDFSWEKAAKEYEKWYKHISEERKRATRPISHRAYSSLLI